MALRWQSKLRRANARLVPQEMCNWIYWQRPSQRVQKIPLIHYTHIAHVRMVAHVCACAQRPSQKVNLANTTSIRLLSFFSSELPNLCTSLILWVVVTWLLILKWNCQFQSYYDGLISFVHFCRVPWNSYYQRVPKIPLILTSIRFLSFFHLNYLIYVSDT